MWGILWSRIWWQERTGRKKEADREALIMECLRSSGDSVCFNNIIIDDKAEDDQQNYIHASSSMICVVWF